MEAQFCNLPFTSYSFDWEEGRLGFEAMDVNGTLVLFYNSAKNEIVMLDVASDLIYLALWYSESESPRLFILNDTEFYEANVPSREFYHYTIDPEFNSVTKKTWSLSALTDLIEDEEPGNFYQPVPSVSRNTPRDRSLSAVVPIVAMGVYGNSFAWISRLSSTHFILEDTSGQKATSIKLPEGEWVSVSIGHQTIRFYDLSDDKVYIYPHDRLIRVGNATILSDGITLEFEGTEDGEEEIVVRVPYRSGMLTNSTRIGFDGEAQYFGDYIVLADRLLKVPPAPHFLPLPGLKYDSIPPVPSGYFIAGYIEGDRHSVLLEHGNLILCLDDDTLVHIERRHGIPYLNALDEVVFKNGDELTYVNKALEVETAKSNTLTIGTVTYDGDFFFSTAEINGHTVTGRNSEHQDYLFSIDGRDLYPLSQLPLRRYFVLDATDTQLTLLGHIHDSYIVLKYIGDTWYTTLSLPLMNQLAPTNIANKFLVEIDDSISILTIDTDVRMSQGPRRAMVR